MDPNRAPRRATNGRTEVAVARTSHPSVECAVAAVANGWQRAVDALEAKRALAQQGSAFAIFTIEGSEVSARLVANTADPTALIVGSHSECDVWVRQGACLRHALLLLWPDGIVEAMDLHTDFGLVWGEQRTTHVVAPSAVRVGVGEADLFAISLDVGTLLPRTPTEVAERLSAAADAVQVGGVEFREAPRAARVDRLSNLAARYGRTIVSRIERFDPLGRFDGQDVADHSDLEVHASLAQLDDGLLMGRYPRCHVGAIWLADAKVSRVHAGVFLRRETLFLVDLASSNGTTVRAAGDVCCRALHSRKRLLRLERDDRIVLAGRDLCLVVDEAN